MRLLPRRTRPGPFPAMNGEPTKRAVPMRHVVARGSRGLSVAPPTGSRRPGAGPAGSAERWREGLRLLRGPLRRLCVGQWLGQAGDGFAQLALAQLVLFEVGAGATPGAIAALLAVTLLPFSLVAPVAGILVDWFDRRRVLTVGSIVRVALVILCGAAVVRESEALGYLSVLSLLSVSRFVLTAKGAALPWTIPQPTLVTGNAVSAVGGIAAAFLGAVIGAFVAGIAPAMGFTVAAAAYLAAAIAFRALPPVGGGRMGVRPADLGDAVRQAASDLADGIRTIAVRPEIRGPLTGVWLHRLLLGAGFVLLVLFADEQYRLEAPGYGLALAAVGVAALVGTLLAPAVAARVDARRFRPMLFVTAGGAAAAAGFELTLPTAIAATGVAAMAFQVLKLLTDAELQRAAGDEIRGRVFAAYDVGFNVAFVVAGLALVPLWQPEREQSLLWAISAGFLAVGLVLARRARTWPFAGSAGAGADTVGMSALRRWGWRVVATLAGTPMMFAFPEPGLWWLAWFGLVPWLLVTRAACSPREAGVRSWLAGTGFVAASHHWLVPITGAFFPVLALAMGLLFLLWGRLAWHLLRRPLGPARIAAAAAVLACAWLATELIRSWQYLGGPWALLGSSQWNTNARHLASLGGIWLLTVAIVVSNVAVACAVLPRLPRPARAASAAMAVAAIGAGPLMGLGQDDAPPGGAVRVAMVQPGPGLGEMGRFAAAEEATRDLADRGIDLVVWGESSVGFDLAERPDLRARLQDLSATVGADVLVNVDARRPGEGGIYKSSVLIGPDGVLSRYDKMRLVPFGEYVPLRPLFGWTAGVTAAADENRRRGEELVVKASGDLRFGALVCFESAFPDLSRLLARGGASLIVYQSATTTFQDSWAPEQHASLASLRAVEVGRPVVHATLTGMSVAVDQHGHVLASMGTAERGVEVVDIPLGAGTTAYALLGDWVPALAAGVLAAAAVTAGARSAALGDASRRTRSGTDDHGEPTETSTATKTA